MRGVKRNKHNTKGGVRMLNQKLKGRIVERYGNVSAFAKAIEMSDPALSNRLLGKTAWKLTEVAKACNLLEIPGSEITTFFLPQSLAHSETSTNN